MKKLKTNIKLSRKNCYRKNKEFTKKRPNYYRSYILFKCMHSPLRNATVIKEFLKIFI